MSLAAPVTRVPESTSLPPDSTIPDKHSDVPCPLSGTEETATRAAERRVWGRKKRPGSPSHFH